MKPLDEIIKENKEADENSKKESIEQAIRYVSIKIKRHVAEISRLQKIIDNLKQLTVDQETLIIEQGRDK